MMGGGVEVGEGEGEVGSGGEEVEGGFLLLLVGGIV